jgi:hypothetical protein
MKMRAKNPMKAKLIAAFVAGLLVMAAGATPAGAIAVEKGGPNGETTTVNDPAITKGGGPNATGANPAHGPWCGVIEAEENGRTCARHADHPDNAAAYNDNLNAEINVGAWNSVFQSNENSAICGIWATQLEATAAGADGAELPTCEGLS